jgi:hypothetical protein
VKFLKVLAVFLFAHTLLYAKLVDAVSIIVENRPITLYEIYAYANKFKIPKDKAVDILIKQRLEDMKIKEFDIRVSEAEIDEDIKSTLQKNSVTEEQFLSMLARRGIDYKEYREDIRKRIQRDKLYEKIIKNELRSIDVNVIREYYENNKELFSTAESIDVIEYRSQNKHALEQIKSNPMLTPNGVTKKTQTLNAQNANPKLYSLLNTLPQKSFSPIIPAKDSFVLFYVDKKAGMEAVKFEDVKNYIYNKLVSEKEKSAIKDYFDKLKTESKIVLVREP